MSASFPGPVCPDSHAVRTDVFCRSRLCEQRLRHTREQHLQLLGVTLFFPALMHGGPTSLDRKCGKVNSPGGGQPTIGISIRSQRRQRQTQPVLCRRRCGPESVTILLHRLTGGMSLPSRGQVREVPPQTYPPTSPHPGLADHIPASREVYIAAAVNRLSKNHSLAVGFAWKTNRSIISGVGRPSRIPARS